VGALFMSCQHTHRRTLTPFEPHKSSSVGDSPANLHIIAINKKILYICLVCVSLLNTLIDMT
jgi:hypothetical protein